VNVSVKIALRLSQDLLQVIALVLLFSVCMFTFMCMTAGTAIAHLSHHNLFICPSVWHACGSVKSGAS